MPDAPNSGSNRKSQPAGLGNQVRALLRTPCAAEAEGGMIHPDKAEREGRTLRLSPQIVHMINPGQLKDKLLPTPRTNDHTGTGEHRRGGRDLRTEIHVTDFAEYAPAVERWAGVVGRESPPPTLINAKGNHQLSGRFVEWMMGLPDGWVTSPDIGLSRAQQLKALGNGVVPQQAKAALRFLLGRRNGNE